MRRLILASILVGTAAFVTGCYSDGGTPDEATLKKELSGPPSSANIRAHKLRGVGQAKAEAATAGATAGGPPPGGAAPGSTTG